MTLNNSMSITPITPTIPSGTWVRHGSFLSENSGPLRVRSQCNSTAPPYAANPLYDEIAEFLLLQALNGPVRAEADAKLAAFMAAKGEDAVFAAIVKGQHNLPDGIRFNGTEPTWSKRVFERMAAGWLGRARRFVVLDIHTGWGRSGEGKIMTYAAPETPEALRLRKWFGHEDVVQLGADQARLAVHPRMPYHVVADLIPGSEVSVVALEYGTDGTLGSSIDLMREDNFVHLRGDPFSPEGRMVRARTRAHFYCETAAWRQAVLARGLSVFDQAMVGLCHWQSESVLEDLR